MALVVALELLADVFGDGGVGGVTKMEDFVRALTAAGAGGRGGAVDGWRMGVAVRGGGVVVCLGVVRGADGAVVGLGVG